MKDPKNIQLINDQVVEIDDEATYRRKLSYMANTLGCRKEFDLLLEKYDGILRRCGNEQERAAIKALALTELNSLFNGSTSVGFGGNLTLDGKVIVSQELNQGKKQGA